MVQLQDTKGEDWEEMSRMYKSLTTGVSVRPITTMLERADALLPFAEATGIHDNGCGPGPVISQLIRDYGSQIPLSCSISCSDFSQGMVEQVKQTKLAEIQNNPSSLWARLDAKVLDAMDLQGIADQSLSHVTAGWVYFMTPDPRKCLSESRRVLKADGVLSLSSWKGSQWLDLMLLAAKVRPQSDMPNLPEAWSSTSGVQAELEQSGFRDVETHEVPVQMGFASYDALADLLLTKMPHMIALLKEFSAEEKAELRSLVISTAQGMVPAEPYLLNGVAIVALGRK